MLPQEIEVFYIIPTIRSSLTRYLKQRGMTQKQIASLFGLRESTVSQYVKLRRASSIRFSKDIDKKISESARRIESRFDVIREIQTILKAIRKSGEICSIHKSFCTLPCNALSDNKRCFHGKK